jgi:hypothetical protein
MIKQPKEMVKFYQKLHLFRVNELPLILSPLCCSQDLILWQCILDVIIKKRISCVSKRSEICKSGGVRKMSAVSENAVRYTAGSVMRKLLEMYKSDTEVTECLRSMLKGGDDIIEHISEVYVHEVDRGFLKHLTDFAHEFFIEVEMVTYNNLKTLGTKDFNISTVHNIVCKDADVVWFWGICSADIESSEKQLSVLSEIAKQWINISFNGHKLALSLLTHADKSRFPITNTRITGV